MTVFVGATAVNNLHDFFWNKVRKVLVVQLFRLGSASGIRRPVGTFVGDDQINIGTPSQFAISLQTVDWGQIVSLLSKPIVIKSFYGYVFHFRRDKPLKRRAAWFEHSRGLILKKGLVGCHLEGLRRTGFAVEGLKPLVALAAVFVVVPHRHEWPSSTRIL